jgi:hypothetical protein
MEFNGGRFARSNSSLPNVTNTCVLFGEDIIATCGFICLPFADHLGASGNRRGRVCQRRAVSRKSKFS